MNQAPALDRDQAYLRIRDLIVSGTIGPNEALSERRLSETLGLSRTPIREALRSLAQDGLLTVLPMRGTFVRQLSVDDLREIHQLRVALEGMAAFLAAEHGPSLELQRCATRLRELAAAPEVDPAESQQIGWQFHDELFRASGNRRLAVIYDNLRAQSGLALQKVRQYDPARVAQAIREHLSIFAAIEARDSVNAQRRMWEHLNRAFQARLQIPGALGSLTTGSEP